mgnify:CR=1 FL=1
MRLRSNLLSLIVGALSLVGLGGQAQALAIPVSLSSLVIPGATLTSEDGNFTFSNFSAITSGAIPHNTGDNYMVLPLSNGFELTGGFLVADGNNGDMLLGYTVTAKSGIRITDVHLLMNGTFTGGVAGNAAAVSETILSGFTPIAILSTSGSSGAGDVVGLTDEFVFGTGYSTLNVKKDISVTTIAGGLRSVAHISVVDQTFTIPEPGTLLLGSFGLLGLASLGRRRVR